MVIGTKSYIFGLHNDNCDTLLLILTSHFKSCAELFLLEKKLAGLDVEDMRVKNSNIFKDF